MWGRDLSCPYGPTTYVAYIVDRDVLQTNVPQHFRDPRAARPFRPRWRGNRGQRRLASERRFVGTLDVRPRGAYAIVGQKCGDGFNHCGELY